MQSGVPVHLSRVILYLRSEKVKEGKATKTDATGGERRGRATVSMGDA